MGSSCVKRESGLEFDDGVDYTKIMEKIVFVF